MNVLELRKGDIIHAMRIDDLYRWYDELEDILIENTSEIKVLRLSGAHERSWVKFADESKNCSILMRYIANRISQMGYEPPINATSWKSNKIAELREIVRDLECKLVKYTRIDEPERMAS